MDRRHIGRINHDSQRKTTDHAHTHEHTTTKYYNYFRARISGKLCPKVPYCRLGQHRISVWISTHARRSQASRSRRPACPVILPCDTLQWTPFARSPSPHSWPPCHLTATVRRVSGLGWGLPLGPVPTIRRDSCLVSGALSHPPLKVLPAYDVIIVTAVGSTRHRHRLCFSESRQLSTVQ